MASDDVARRLDEVRWSTEGLLSALRERPPTDSWARQPSLLPGWTRGHVLSHLARNAEAMVRTLSGTARGERIPMYDSEDARAADIEAGTARPAADLAADVVGTARRLDETWVRLDDAAWQQDAVTRNGPVPAIRLIGMRWREVEIHRVDLADRYGPGDWPASLLAPLLPSLLDPRRIGPRLPDGLTVEVVNTDSGQRWLVGADVPAAAGTARSARAAAVRSAAAPPVRVVGPSWALVGWLIGRPAAVRSELGEPPLGRVKPYSSVGDRMSGWGWLDERAQLGGRRGFHRGDGRRRAGGAVRGLRAGRAADPAAPLGGDTGHGDGVARPRRGRPRDQRPAECRHGAAGAGRPPGGGAGSAVGGGPARDRRRAG